jgi:D-tyrosyl-tRNA(Tyr) deacylase
MRAFVQRVLKADVSVNSDIVGQIGTGLLVLLGIKWDDTEVEAEQLARKILNLRIFDDESGKMNRSVTDVKGGVLIVSQFTLYGDTARGNRPSYSDAAKAEVAEPLYKSFIRYCEKTDVEVSTGVFGATMLVSLVNDGPVSLLCETNFK